MIHFLELLRFRSEPLFIFGGLNLIAACIFFLISRFSNIIVRGVNAWYKPLKFGLSIGIFSWTMGWITYDLHAPGQIDIYNWVVIILLGFEIVYISLQAGKGLLSHYNMSSSVYSILTALMGIAAAIATLWTGYIGILFMNADLPGLPDYYLLSIRMGIFIFVFFAFEGAAMGARGTHTIGGAEGGPALPILNWSKRFGDLRIAHFIGMHALQVLPLLSWYILKNSEATLILGLFYAGLAIYSLIRAIRGKAWINIGVNP